MKTKLVFCSMLFAAALQAQVAIPQTVSYGLLSGTSGNYNTYLGYGAGYSTQSGDQNTFIGYNAGSSTISGSQNTFIGYKAGFSSTNAIQNHFAGYQSGYSNTIGFLNHFEGFNSGYMNTIGNENQFMGLNAGYNNTSGNTNLFIGINAGRENTSASNNHFVGQRAGVKNTTGANNYFSGFQAGFNNTIGSNNYFSGYQAGFSNVTGTGNVFIGYKSGYSETGSNKLYISNSESTSPLVYGDFNLQQVTFNGKVGVGTSTPRRELEVNGNIVLPNSTGKKQIYTWDAYDENWRIGMSENPGFNRVLATSHVEYLTYWDGPGQGFAIGRNLGESSFEITGANHTAFFRGNVGIGTIPTNKLQVVNAYCDGNTWYNVSDKNLKENFARIKPNESILDKVMSLPIQYWNYKTDKANRHIGPTAQDFYKVFQLGVNEKAISTIDESGIALAAIQELNKQTQELKTLVNEQQQLIASLLQAKIEEDNLSQNESGLKLHQNIPNPFQRDTKITMEIPQNINQAVLYVYDLQGKPVEQQTIQGRGTTSTVIEGGKLSSGVYLYMLIGDGKATGAKRMVLTD